MSFEAIRNWPHDLHEAAMCWPMCWKLSPTQSFMLVAIARRESGVSRRVLFDMLYGSRADGGPLYSTLNVQLSHLRRKLATFLPEITIITIWGRGWGLSADHRTALLAHYEQPPR